MHSSALEVGPTSFVSRYGIAVLSVMTATVLTVVFRRLGYPGLFSLFYGAVLVGAWFGGLGPALISTALSASVSTLILHSSFNLFTMAPTNVGWLAVFVLVSLLICRLGAAHRQSLLAGRASDRHYRELFERNIAGVFLTDIEGRILDCNESFARILGHDSREQVLKRQASDFYFDVADRDAVIERLQSEKTVHLFESCVRGKDDKPVWIIENLSLLKDHTGARTLLQGTIIDITARKRADQALVESEKNFRNIADTVPAFIYLLGPDAKVQFVNKPLLDFHGMSLDQYLEIPPDEPLHPDDRKRSFDDFQAVFHSRKPFSSEFRMRGVEREYRWFLNTCVPSYASDHQFLGYIGTCVDITDRKMAEEALREAQEKYLSIFENALEGIFRTSPDGRFLIANQALARMTGYDSPTDLIEDRDLIGDRPGLARESYVDAKRSEEFKRLMEEHGEVRGFEFEVRRKDGSKIWISEHVRAVRDEAGILLYYEGTAEDITDRKRVEEALRTREAQLTDAQVLAHLGSWEWDIARDIVTWSDELHRIWGIERKDFRGTYESVLQCIHPDDREAFNHLVQTSYRDGTAYSCEHRITRPDGEIRRSQARGEVVLDEAGNPVRMFGTSQDITDRNVAEEALRRSEERYRELFENAQDAIYVHDLKGRYISVNRAGEKLSGYSRDEIIGKSFSRFVVPKYLKELRAKVREKLVSGTDTDYEIEIIAKDGRRVPVEVSSRLLYENGVPIGVQGIARDISSRKRTEEALRNFPRRLIGAQEAERRRVARELHDGIGQALTAIKINLQDIQRSTADSALVQRLNENAAIVDNALQQVRELSLDLRPSLLDDLGLTAALRWYVERESRRMRLVLELNIDVSEIRLAPEVETACFRIAQEALTNIARHAHAKRVRVELTLHEADLNLAISDDGVGFDVGRARRRFASDASLGLQGMQERAIAVGGRIEIEAAEGCGTRIHVQLPFIPYTPSLYEN